MKSTVLPTVRAWQAWAQINFDLVHYYQQLKNSIALNQMDDYKRKKTLHAVYSIKGIT